MACAKCKERREKLKAHWERLKRRLPLRWRRDPDHGMRGHGRRKLINKGVADGTE